MKVSIFTPTHKPDWLLEAYQSLVKQTYKDWEWIIQPNGPKHDSWHLLAHQIPEEIKKDPRVRILPYTLSDGIGCLKKICCLHAVGDIYVELDHDDWLLPEALQEIVIAVKAGAGFVYSDSVHYFEDHSSEVFAPPWGWEHYKLRYDNWDYTVMRSFPATARSLCEIYWAPNHVRAWTKEAYEKVGGHSGQLRIADDHDLICRTYLAGINFYHVQKPLYFYRRFKEGSTENSFVAENRLVQEQQARNKEKYLHPLVIEWCQREGLPVIDLDPTKGFTADDSSVGCFRINDYLQRIPIAEVPQLMNRLYDKLVPGGWMLTSTPAVCDNEGRAGRGAFQDPTHVSYWSSNNFWYYTNKDYARFAPEIRCRFQAVRLGNGYPSDFHRTHLIPYVWADLYALKGQRVPGQQLI